MRVAADILQGKKICKGVRTTIFPGSQKIYKQALSEGLIEIFIEAGAIVRAPTCVPCLELRAGILSPGEKAISTLNRNACGNPASNLGYLNIGTYLSSPAVAAASALTGKITNPEDIK